MRRAAVFACFAIAAAPAGARADPYRLRADAYAAASSTPAGLMVVQAEARERSYYDAEALVWTGTGERAGDVLVVAVGLRDPEGRGEVRAGRMVLSTGAVRSLHLDGATITARLPFGPSLQVFGGLPVEPGFASRSFDWALGQRTAMSFGETASFGVSYLQRRDDGRIAYEELGVDAGVRPLSWLDAAALTALDLEGAAVVDVRGSIAARARRSLRIEAFAARRSPSRLLPATSLFSALGDLPTDRLGGSLSFRAAPRLDVSGSGAVESLGGELGGEQSVRGTLRLDDRGDGALGLEARRSEAPLSSWTGVRATARVPVVRRFGLSAATEVEVAVPDDAGDRGAVWPWALAALSLRPSKAWEAATAIEAGASPAVASFVTGLVRLSARWGEP